jgi:hypothetical protein
MIDLTFILSATKIEDRTIPQFTNPYFVYKNITLTDYPNCHAYHLENPSYPIQKIQIDDYDIFIEGCIYDPFSTIQKKISALISKIKTTELRSEIEKFQDENAGEYNIYILQKKQTEIKRFIFFSDALGRLQTFYTFDSTRFIITRNLKLLIPFLRSKTLNTHFIADSLVFGFPLNNRSVYNEIETSNEGQIIDVVINVDNHNLNITKHQSVIDLTSQKKFKLKEDYIEHILPMIKKSIDDRLGFIGDQNFCCDLTGGFDSRTVFGYLPQNKNVTFTTNLLLGDETKTVYELVDKYGLRDKLLVIPEEKIPETESFNQLLYHLQNFTGNHKANAISWQALETQKKIINTQYRIGGIGFTDFVRKGIRNDQRSLIDNFSDSNPYGLTIGQTIALLNISKDDYLHHLNKTITTWPEKTNADIHKRFFYLRTLILQSRLTEDRERYHYWTIHPLWDHSLCFDTLKYFPLTWRGYHIHYLLLKAIDPLLVDVEINKSYLDIKNERSLKTIDFKENNTVYRTIKGILKKNIKPVVNIKSINNLDSFLQNKNTELSKHPELNYLKLSFDQLNSI